MTRFPVWIDKSESEELLAALRLLSRHLTNKANLAPNFATRVMFLRRLRKIGRLHDRIKNKSREKTSVEQISWGMGDGYGVSH